LKDATAMDRGFGLDLIEQRLPYELKAETWLEFRPDGLHCAIELPLDDAARVKRMV
jgi:two-component sensor histidine kinase